MATQWTVTTPSGVWCRKDHTTSAASISLVNKGVSVTELEKYEHSTGETWIRYSIGWMCVKLASGKYLASASTQTPAKNTNAKANPEEAKKDDKNKDAASSTSDGDGSGYRPSTDSLNIFGGSKYLNAKDYATIDNALGIFGLPYQWLPIADPRIDGSMNNSAMGEVYAEDFVSNMPLLLLTPGKASFMTKFSQKEKKNILEKMISSWGSNDQNSLSDILQREGRYYTFEADKTDYFKYFNPMARIGARYLELQNEKLDGKPLDEINWADYIKTRVKKFADIGDMEALPFYINSETSVSESFSNSTTESQIASTVNSVSDMGRELNFLLGYAGNATSLAIDNTDINQNIENVQNTVSSLLGKNNFINSLATHLTTVASGGRLTFPEIWADSSYSKSYDVTIKLTSPDADKLSLFLNIILPIFALVALVAPQSLSANPNGYNSPFLVRATYKGIFNIDTGIITSMSITKGAEGMWTPDGIPTQAEVSLTIKDLYQIMSVTSTELKDIKYSTLNNTALMDFIASTCGINIFQPEIGRTIDMWLVNTLKTKISDFVKIDIWQGVKDKVYNLITNIFRSY